MSLDRRELELRDLIAALWSRRLLLGASILLFSVAFGAVAFLATPVYRASVSVMDASMSRDGGMLGRGLGSLGGLASLTGLNLMGANQQSEEALAVLRSRDFTERFITDLGLMPVLYAEKWDAQTKSWRGDSKSWPRLAQAAKRFDKDIRAIVRDKLTGLVSVEIEWHDPVVAADWANELISRLNSEMRKRTISHTNRTVEYLNKELATTSTIETRETINRLMEAQINERMLASVTSEYAFRIVDKALPPDPRDIAKPRKALLILLGPIVGFTVGAVVVFLLAALRPARIET